LLSSHLLLYFQVDGLSGTKKSFAFEAFVKPIVPRWTDTFAQRNFRMDLLLEQVGREKGGMKIG
jgi:hypothetical protein